MTTSTLTLTRNTLSPMIDAALAAAPRSKERPVKGGELLLAGKVQRVSVDRWLVYGSGEKPYAVSIHAGTCTCDDGRAMRSPLGQKLCKHMYACMFGLKAGMEAPVEVAPKMTVNLAALAEFNAEAGGIDEDPRLWAAEENPDAILDAEIAAKLDEMTAAGLDAEADLLVIGDWVWLVGDVDPDLADALGCRWHDRREVHYWRPVWAAMDVDGFNEKKDLMGLAQKYGLKKTLPRRSRRQEERTAQELAMLIVPRLNRDEDGELWA